MRAYMSTPGDGPLYYDGDTLAHSDGRTFTAPYALDAEAVRLSTFAALAEARAILAETERVPETPLSAGFFMRAADLWAAPGASLALADALRAFVEGN